MTAFSEALCSVRVRVTPPFYGQDTRIDLHAHNAAKKLSWEFMLKDVASQVERRKW
jgi:hypothetical protein